MCGRCGGCGPFEVLEVATPLEDEQDVPPLAVCPSCRPVVLAARARAEASVFERLAAGMRLEWRQVGGAGSIWFARELVG